MRELLRKPEPKSWTVEQLDIAQDVSERIEGYFANPMLPAGHYFSDAELDQLFPVAEGVKTASLHWGDIRTLDYRVRNGVDSDRQLAFTFARCADAIAPNDLSHAQRTARLARYMRSMQHGVHLRNPDEYRDHSESYTAKLLSEARGYISGSPLLAFDQARQDSGLVYTPAKRVHNVAHSIRTLIKAQIQLDTRYQMLYTS